MFAEQILRLVAGLFVGIWVARYLGPRQLGVFGYALAFVAIFGSIAKLGLDEVIRCNIDAKWPALGELVCAHKSLIPKSA